MAEIKTEFDVPRYLRENDAKVTVYVKYRGMWRVSLGLRFIQFGCWIAGLGLEEADLMKEVAGH